MKARSWLVLAAGFGILVALIGLLGFGAVRRSRAIHDEMAAAQAAYLETDSFLRDIPADLYLAGLSVRDYLLDPSHLTAPLYRKQLFDLRASLEQRLDVLEGRMNGAEAATVHQMRTEVRAYWDSAEPVFAWTPNQKTALSHSFLQQRVLPRRNAVLALAEQVARWNFSNLRHEQRRLATRQERLHSFLDRMTTGALLLGLLVALLTTARVWILERRSRRQLEHIEGAERELRRLSRSLVRAQEQERKSLSRELHDVVGQMLTAMGMELGNLGSLRAAPEKFRDHLEGVKSLNSETLRTVRDLAMGLRPSMLDDLGLGAALNWQGREFSRRSGVPVSVQIDGELDDIPEAQRTCIFRVVQEALTNCARHARAKSIRVSVYGGPGTVTLTVQDDGIGFDPYDRAARGLGLLGIEERVREEGGVVRVDSEPARGTILRVDVPLRQGVPA